MNVAKWTWMELVCDNKAINCDKSSTSTCGAALQPGRTCQNILGVNKKFFCIKFSAIYFKLLVTNSLAIFLWLWIWLQTFASLLESVYSHCSQNNRLPPHQATSAADLQPKVVKRVAPSTSGRPAGTVLALAPKKTEVTVLPQREALVFLEHWR